MEIKINLIPPYRKEIISQVRKLRFVLRTGIIFFIILALFTFFLFGLDSFLDVNLKTISSLQSSGLERGKYERISELDKSFESINLQVGDIMAIKKDQLYWSKVFIELSKTIISGIKINEITTKNFNIFLTGNSINRDILIKFKEGLDSGTCFYDVNLPLSNLVSKENIDFQIDFKIKDECLRKDTDQD